MAGTKMTLRRYGNEFTYWYEQEIIVDQNFLDTNNGLFITLTHPYVMGTKMLDVYLNGQLLSEGGGYEEIDETLIRLDLGIYEGDHRLAGKSVPLQVGDEIYIRTWKAEYRNNTSGGIDDLRFKMLEEEVIAARKYRDLDTPYPKLDDRLDDIQEKAETRIIVLVLTGVVQGASKYEIRFPLDGQVTEVYASCITPGTTDTIIQVEKCSHADFISTPVWTSILGQDVVFEAGNNSSDTSSLPHTVTVPKVDKNDHFRLNVLQVGSGIEGVTLEVVIRT